MSQTILKNHNQDFGAHFEHIEPQEILNWGVEQFDTDIVLACSFGAEDIVLVDMLVKAHPQPAIFYLDTDLHFPETYETRDRLVEKYNIDLIQVKPKLSLQQQALQYGNELWKRDPDLCCQIRKVEPLIDILSSYKAWITGIRREQSSTRKNVGKVEWDTRFQLYKFNPLASWTHDQVWAYIRDHNLPYNPLHDQHYPSIGCSVCTRPVLSGGDLRSGRWNGLQKTECGLHK